jgi:hypothetical protein
VSKSSGRSVRSGGSSASEIRGARPSSRRRLAQKAAAITASTAAVSGGPSAGASPALSAKNALSRSATIRAGE